MKILAILQNAYTDPRRAAILRDMLSFTINPENLTGKKLYRITAGHELRVTNACPEIYHTANEKGKTDLEKLKLALTEWDYDLYISCGKQSNEAVNKCLDMIGSKPLFIMPHPASRNLTNALLDEVQRQVNYHKPSNYTWEFIQLKGGFKINANRRTE